MVETEFARVWQPPAVARNKCIQELLLAIRPAKIVKSTSRLSGFIDGQARQALLLDQAGPLTPEVEALAVLPRGPTPPPATCEMPTTRQRRRLDRRTGGSRHLQHSARHAGILFSEG
jgi:hypothetical protein